VRTFEVPHFQSRAVVIDQTKLNDPHVDWKVGDLGTPPPTLSVECDGAAAALDAPARLHTGRQCKCAQRVATPTASSRGVSASLRRQPRRTLMRKPCSLSIFKRPSSHCQALGSLPRSISLALSASVMTVCAAPCITLPMLYALILHIEIFSVSPPTLIHQPRILLSKRTRNLLTTCAHAFSSSCMGSTVSPSWDARRKCLLLLADYCEISPC